MLHALACVFLIAACWSSTIAPFGPRQNPQPLTEVNFRVRGVGLGSPYAQVLRRFGRPPSTKRETILVETEICGPSYTSLVLRYHGALIELHGDLRGRNFEVVEIELTSSKFLITPGIRIGMTEKEVRSRIGGPPWQVLTESHSQILDYVTKENLGGASLHFRNGRLVKVHWKYTLC